jgi:hypothetical protein
MIKAYRQLTNIMELYRPWEACSFSAAHEINSIIWNLKVHYCIHTSLPLVPILRLMNPVQTLLSYFFDIHFNIIILSMSRCS